MGHTMDGAQDEFQPHSELPNEYFEGRVLIFSKGQTLLGF